MTNLNEVFVFACVNTDNVDEICSDCFVDTLEYALEIREDHQTTYSLMWDGEDVNTAVIIGELS